MIRQSNQEKVQKSFQSQQFDDLGTNLNKQNVKVRTSKKSIKKKLITNQKLSSQGSELQNISKKDSQCKDQKLNNQSACHFDLSSNKSRGSPQITVSQFNLNDNIPKPNNKKQNIQQSQPLLIKKYSLKEQLKELKKELNKAIAQKNNQKIETLNKSKIKLIVTELDQKKGYAELTNTNSKIKYSKQIRESYIKKVKQSFDELMTLNQGKAIIVNGIKIQRGQFYLNICHYEDCIKDVQEVIKNSLQSCNDPNYIRACIIKIKICLFQGEIAIAELYIFKIKKLIQDQDKYNGKTRQQIIQETIQNQNQIYLEIVLLQIKCINMKERRGAQFQKWIKFIIQKLMQRRKLKQNYLNPQNLESTHQIDQRFKEIECRAIQQLGYLYNWNKATSSAAQKMLRLSIYYQQKDNNRSITLDSLFLNLLKLQYNSPIDQQKKQQIKQEFNLKSQLVFQCYDSKHPFYWKKMYLKYVIFRQSDQNLQQKLQDMLSKIKQYYNLQDKDKRCSNDNLATLKIELQIATIKLQQLRLILNKNKKNQKIDKQIDLKAYSKLYLSVQELLQKVQFKIKNTKQQFDKLLANRLQNQNHEEYTFKSDHKIAIKAAIQKLIQQIRIQEKHLNKTNRTGLNIKQTNQMLEKVEMQIQENQYGSQIQSRNELQSKYFKEMQQKQHQNKQIDQNTGGIMGFIKRLFK